MERDKGRQLRNFAYAIVTASAFCLLPGTGSRAQTADPSKIDILGFHLGMTPDDVKSTAATAIQTPAFAVKQGVLTMGTFKSAPVVFGVEVSEGPDRQLNDPDKEFLYFVFDQRSPYGVISMRRKKSFTQANAPTVQNLKSSLIEKYGQPAGVEDGYGVSRMFWTFNSGVKYARSGLDSGTCSGNVGLEGYGGFLYQGQFTTNTAAWSRIEKCGAWIVVMINPSMSNQSIVNQFQIDVGNLKDIHDSVVYMLDTLQKGAAGTASSEANQAAKNKPKL